MINIKADKITIIDQYGKEILVMNQEGYTLSDGYEMEIEGEV